MFSIWRAELCEIDCSRGSERGVQHRHGGGMGRAVVEERGSLGQSCCGRACFRLWPNRAVSSRREAQNDRGEGFRAHCKHIVSSDNMRTASIGFTCVSKIFYDAGLKSLHELNEITARLMILLYRHQNRNHRQWLYDQNLQQISSELLQLFVYCHWNQVKHFNIHQHTREITSFVHIYAVRHGIYIHTNSLAILPTQQTWSWSYNFATWLLIYINIFQLKHIL